MEITRIVIVCLTDYCVVWQMVYIWLEKYNMHQFLNFSNGTHGHIPQLFLEVAMGSDSRLKYCSHGLKNNKHENKIKNASKNILHKI